MRLAKVAASEVPKLRDPNTDIFFKRRFKKGLYVKRGKDGVRKESKGRFLDNERA